MACREIIRDVPVSLHRLPLLYYLHYLSKKAGKFFSRKNKSIYSTFTKRKHFLRFAQIKEFCFTFQKRVEKIYALRADKSNCSTFKKRAEKHFMLFTRTKVFLVSYPYKKE